jgi:hypothetical protein
MIKLKFIRSASFILGVILTTIIISSCDDDNKVPPEYVGKWVTEKPIAVATGFLSIKYYLELTQNEFKETFIQPPQTAYSKGNQISLEGTVSVSGNILKLIIHKLSVSHYDSTTGTFSEPYETHIYKDQDFGFESGSLGMPTSNHQVEFSLIDGKLICKVDYNRDGIYSENEKTIYSRQ